MGHKCHAVGCDREVPPRYLMCGKHWGMVPRELQRAVWRDYVPGQEVRKDPTRTYLETAGRAIQAVAEVEGKVYRRLRRTGYVVAAKEGPVPGMRCGVCKLAVTRSPSGLACVNGHGGAEEDGEPRRLTYRRRT